jgi:peptidoglycan/LPS O-acetylase OafA/YrhL
MLNLVKRYILLLNTSDIKRIGHRQDLHSIRGLAVIVVIFYHADFELFKGGWLGVDLFFVISGYLISNIIISEINSGTFNFKSFYLRRFRRIVPAMLSTLVVTTGVAYLLLTPKAILDYSKLVLSSLFFYANFYLQNLDFYNAEPSKLNPLIHIWSLSVEEQFYILFPLIIFLLLKGTKKYLFLILLFITLLSIYSNSFTQDITKFYSTQYRIWEFLLGSLLVFFSFKKFGKFFTFSGFTLIIFSVVKYEDTMLNLNSIEPKLIALLGVSLVIASNDASLNRIYSNQLVVYAGTLSYSLYLLHQPIFSFLRIFGKKSGFEITNLFYLIAICVIVVFSYLNWKYIEKFFLTKDNFPNLIKFSTFAVSGLIIFTLNSVYTNGYESRYDFVPDEVLFYSKNTNLYPTENEITEFNNYECSQFNSNKKKLIFIGDSHLNTLSVSIMRNFKESSCNFDFRFIYNPTGRCILSKQNDTGVINVCTDEYFDSFINNSLSKDTTVVAIGRFNTWLESEIGSQVQCEGCDYIEIMKKRFEDVSNSSNKLLVVEPVPTYPVKIAESYLYKNTIWGESITIDYLDWEYSLNRWYDFVDNLDKNNIEIIESSLVFCNQFDVGKCTASTGKNIFYSDDNHLTIEGANLLVERILLTIDSLD